MWRTAMVGALSVVLFGVGGVGLFTLARPSGQSTFPVSGRSAPDVAGNPVILSGTLQQAIASLQVELRSAPADWSSWATLGLAYVQEGRVTADPRYYPKAQGALRRSLQLHPIGNFAVDTGEGALAAARHRFAEALRWGERARSVNPYNGNVYGVIGDAQVELGRYRRAFSTFQHMVDIQPDLSAYARVSYARELLGNVPGAVAAMKLALSAAGTPEDRAFAASQLGDLFFNSGRPGRAAGWYREAVQFAPEYFPPQAGLAKVAWAEGRQDQAIARYRSVVERYPLPEYAIALGDLYAQRGDGGDARRQYALVRVEERLFRAAGVNVDLELALFDADHGRPGAALRTARSEWRRRRSVLVADALAWALYQNHRYADAERYSRLALKLGYRNALLRFHAGMIELALGRGAAARADLRMALRINPHFSILYSPMAARMLGRPRSGA
jgi:tetratricopeptide (TPR) repeat protein